MIDNDNTCDIIYSDMFEIMNLERGSLYPDEGSYLQAFNRMSIRSWGYIELAVSVGEGKDIQTINFQFLVVPYRSVYNCILGKPLQLC